MEIIPFRPEHAAAFYTLNRAWLDEHGLYEPHDEEQLADPMDAIIGTGGTIFVAVSDDEVIGTAAVVPCGPGTVELVKLGVALRLYESMGFIHQPLPATVPYETADVYMELRLVPSPQ